MQEIVAVLDRDGVTDAANRLMKNRRLRVVK
jgi:hypothetical protein